MTKPADHTGVDPQHSEDATCSELGGALVRFKSSERGAGSGERGAGSLTICWMLP